MSASIGGVTLEYSLNWETQNIPLVPIIEKRALDGTIVQSYLQGQAATIDEPHTFKFNWITAAQLASIMALIKTKATFSISCSSSGPSLAGCRFRGSDPIKYDAVINDEFFSPADLAVYKAASGNDSPLDLYNGSIDVWVRR